MPEQHLDIKLKKIACDLSEVADTLGAEHAMNDTFIRVSEEDVRRLTWVLDNLLPHWTRQKIDYEMNKVDKPLKI